MQMLAIMGKLSDNELNVHSLDNENYITLKQYVFTLDNFIALIIFCDTIKECNWKKYPYLVSGGISLKSSIIEIWKESDSIESDSENYSYLNNNNNILKYVFRDKNKIEYSNQSPREIKIKDLESFFDNISMFLHKINIPKEILDSTKNDIYLSLLLYVDHLVDQIT